MYRALKGHDTVYVILRNDSPPDELVGLPLESALAEIAGEESGESVSVKLHDVYLAEIENLESDDLDTKFAASGFAQSLVGNDAARKSHAKLYRKTFKNLSDLYKKQKLVAFYLLDMSLDKFCIFFERSNSKAIQLNFTDILAAKLYHGFNLRQKIDEYEDKFSITLNREMIVRTVAYMTAIEKHAHPVIDKKAILETLTPEDFVNHWDKACTLFKECLDYLLKQHFIVKRNWLPSENMLVPLMIFLSHVKGFDRINETQRVFIEFWFWSSVFANKYSMSSNEVIIADCQALTQVALGESIEKRDFFTKLRSQVSEPDDLFSYTKRTSAIYRGVLNLIGYAHKGLLDWKSSQKIDSDKDFDDHHIFPRAYIAATVQVDMENIDAMEIADSVVNRTLIPKNLNLKIGKKSPQEYFKDLLQSHPSLSASVANHLIPEELISNPAMSTMFGKFATIRSQSIMGLIEQYAIEPLGEMEAKYAPAKDSLPTSAKSEKILKGLRTPERSFELPILTALVKSGGKAQIQHVFDLIAESMKSTFRDVDHLHLKSDPKRPRWQNTAQWARNTMIGRCWLVKGSPHGVWEITDLGRKQVKKK